MQKPTCSGKAAGKQHPVLGREAEIAGESGKEPHCQGERNKDLQVSGLCVQQGQRGAVHPNTPEISAESQEQTAGADVQEPGKERPAGDEERKAVHDWMAELLWDSIHEEPNGRMERMASPKIPSVHLETMEEAKNQIPKSDKVGHPGEICLDDSHEPERILVHGGNHRCYESHIKRKAHTRRIL